MTAMTKSVFGHSSHSNLVMLSPEFETAESRIRSLPVPPEWEGEAMKKSRYTEEQVAYTLRLAESARRSPMSAVKWALPRRRSTCGRRNTAAWEPTEVRELRSDARRKLLGLQFGLNEDRIMN